MSSTPVLTIVTSEHLTIGTTAAHIAAARPYPAVFRVYANRHVHVATTGADATTTDLPVNEFTEAFVSVPADTLLSVIKGTGETDGDVWVSEVKVIG